MVSRVATILALAFAFVLIASVANAHEDDNDDHVATTEATTERTDDDNTDDSISMLVL